VAGASAQGSVVARPTRPEFGRLAERSPGAVTTRPIDRRASRKASVTSQEGGEVTRNR